jgi:biotin transport system substrate-specific component
MLRWLMIGLLVSLGALLIAAAGAARHILLQRKRQRTEALAAISAAPEQEPDREPWIAGVEEITVVWAWRDDLSSDLKQGISVPMMSKAVPQAIAGDTKAATWLRSAGIVLAGSAFVAVCAHVVLPLNFTPVPLTMQTFAVLVLALLLSPRLAAATMTAYLVEGALGLPVFSPVPVIAGGMAHLLGPTGGYLLAYPAAAALIASLWRSTRGSFAGALGSATAGNLLMLICGGAWLAVLTHAPVATILWLGVVPFLPGEGLKIMAAALVTFSYQRFRRRAD